ncbi:hypothetical protein MKZ38_002760 [Zalerion maritima]|uniref:FAD-binding PCMH-type domain-containing protein n=1 Tax=Zalerion maritima TaxID=339359 RepID=A0AAD5RNJ5_9PEZI|nr:hypothetical protein MKZ38_002760 [Zalerion maritima]
MPSMKAFATTTTIALAASVFTGLAAAGYGHSDDACTALATLLPESQILYPSSLAYNSSNTYWSTRQSDLSPTCFVLPSNSSEVSLVLTTLLRLKTPFSVKGGGHTAFTGGSNIDSDGDSIAGSGSSSNSTFTSKGGSRADDGVTIDLSLLNTITLSNPSTTENTTTVVSVGPGTRWIDISLLLDPLGLAVVAGRVSDVGVPGLVLGGGISYFSGLYGWACDNILSYEVVLPSGSIVVASPSSRPDLYRALRGGGGSNFGIVTRFDLFAFPQGDLWSQSLIFPDAVVSSLFLPLYVDLVTSDLPSDGAAHTFFAYTYISALGGYSGITNFYHATQYLSPSPLSTIPAAFSPFQSLPSLVNATSLENITTRSLEIREEYGHRQTWWDATFLLSPPGGNPSSSQLLTDVIPLFRSLVSAMNSSSLTTAAADGVAPEVTSFLVFQPLAVNTLRAMQKNGGNILGLAEDDGALMMMQLSSTWDSQSLDSLVEEETQKTLGEIKSMAEERGLLHRFQYMNYAGKSQDVFSGYGEDSARELKKVARKYDERRELQRYWKGYFQVGY